MEASRAAQAACFWLTQNRGRRTSFKGHNVDRSRRVAFSVCGCSNRVANQDGNAFPIGWCERTNFHFHRFICLHQILRCEISSRHGLLAVSEVVLREVQQREALESRFHRWSLNAKRESSRLRRAADDFDTKKRGLRLREMHWCVPRTADCPIFSAQVRAGPSRFEVECRACLPTSHAPPSTICARGTQPSHDARSTTTRTDGARDVTSHATALRMELRKLLFLQRRH